MHPELTQWLTAHGYSPEPQRIALTGGCINDVSRLQFKDDRSLLLKQNNQPPPRLFAAEAEGLAALAAAVNLNDSSENKLIVPQVMLVGENFLLLQDLGQGHPGAHYWQQFGEGLARLHAVHQPSFGFSADNYCGSTAQCNSPMEDGYAFFATHRILALTQQASGRGLLNTDDVQGLARIAARLADWVPEQAPALLHGDLWSGNCHCTGEGKPAVIDPACYWGWPEAELAMTLLFGGFGNDFYQAYESASKIAPDWRERAPLYNLYHLLNHLLLFGGSYHSQIQSILQRFAPRQR